MIPCATPSAPPWSTPPGRTARPAADRRPRLRALRRDPPRLPRPVHQRRRRRTEHGRRRGRPGQGRLPADRVRPERLRAGARPGTDQDGRLLRIAAGDLHRRRRRRRLQHPRDQPSEHGRHCRPARRARPVDPVAGRRGGDDGGDGAGVRRRRAGLSAHGQVGPGRWSTHRSPDLQWGRMLPMQDGGGPLVWLATGSMVRTALAAAREWPGSAVWSAPCIKPLDAEHVAAVCGRHEAVVVLEEHSIYGGLGSAVAECTSTHGPTWVCRVGVRDRFSRYCGSYDYLMREHRLDVESVRRRCETSSRGCPVAHRPGRWRRDPTASSRSHAVRGTARVRRSASRDIAGRDAERPDVQSHAERGTEERWDMPIRQEILNLVEGHFAETWPDKPFRPGVDPVPVSGKVFDADDVKHLVDASLDFWLTTGRYAASSRRSSPRSSTSATPCSSTLAPAPTSSP